MRDLRNAARGEVALSIDGEPHRLCLTLGALAELEAAFDAPSLDALAKRIAHLSADDLILVIAALSEGAGMPLSRAQIAKAVINPAEAAHAVAKAFVCAFGE